MLISKKAFAALLLFFISSQVNAQNQKTKNQFQIDSLNIQRRYLIKEKNLLRNAIDSLKKYSTELDIKIEHSLEEIRKNKEAYLIAKYGREDGLKVFMGLVWKGMTENMLRDSWGNPDKIDKSVYTYGAFTQWYYGDIIYFFKNKKLIDWEEKRKPK